MPTLERLPVSSKLLKRHVMNRIEKHLASASRIAEMPTCRIVEVARAGDTILHITIEETGLPDRQLELTIVAPW